MTRLWTWMLKRIIRNLKVTLKRLGKAMKRGKNLLEEYHMTGLQTFEEEVEGPLIFINDMKVFIAAICGSLRT